MKRIFFTLRDSFIDSSTFFYTFYKLLFSSYFFYTKSANSSKIKANYHFSTILFFGKKAIFRWNRNLRSCTFEEIYLKLLSIPVPRKQKKANDVKENTKKKENFLWLSQKKNWQNIVQKELTQMLFNIFGYFIIWQYFHLSLFWKYKIRIFDVNKLDE